ncbi:unnamed protein product [Rangifer tarandus platyrhynchus]|uniref:Uncharacterized protein n=2 Tax=Rangifer tarandus platyrhynchus TaxID=3082113 RepID=A0AC59ZTF6_RANTA|nr:unnamed protein product [Rangifer tarandus platyrhynchus]
MEGVLPAFLGLFRLSPQFSACLRAPPWGSHLGLGPMLYPFIILPCKQLEESPSEGRKKRPVFDPLLPVAKTHGCVVFASCFAPSPGSIHTWHVGLQPPLSTDDPPSPKSPQPPQPFISQRPLAPSAP